MRFFPRWLRITLGVVVELLLLATRIIYAASESKLNKKYVRQGKRPDGTAINEFMPWRVFANMTDDGVHAIWLYLQSVPPKPFGNK